MTIENNKGLKLEQIEKTLKKKLPDYDYKIVNNNVVLVSKDETVQLNVIVEEETIQIVEAVGFVGKLAVAIGTIGLAFYFMQTMELATWIRVIVYLLAFLIGGLLGDFLHKARYAKQYKGFKPKVEGVIMKMAN
ncbi:MAG: hypothetical protein AB8G11_19370 [Saprospiraceae bacterium]